MTGAGARFAKPEIRRLHLLPMGQSLAEQRGPKLPARGDQAFEAAGRHPLGHPFLPNQIGRGNLAGRGKLSQLLDGYGTKTLAVVAVVVIEPPIDETPVCSNPRIDEPNSSSIIPSVSDGHSNAKFRRLVAG